MNLLKSVLGRFSRKVNLDILDEKMYITIANEYISALGGIENIKNLYYCSTRIRVGLKNNYIDNEKLIEYGVKKIIKLDDLNYQIVLGKNAVKIEETMKRYLR